MRRTLAAGGVVLGVADRVLGARRIGQTRAGVDAVLLEASLVVGTVGVGATFDALATFERIAGIARRTSALGAVVGSVAFGVARTWVAEDAWVDALAVVALFVVGTFVIVVASNYKNNKLYHQNTCLVGKAVFGTVGEGVSRICTNLYV